MASLQYLPLIRSSPVSAIMLQLTAIYGESLTRMYACWLCEQV